MEDQALDNYSLEYLVTHLRREYERGIVTEPQLDRVVEAKYLLYGMVEAGSVGAYILDGWPEIFLTVVADLAAFIRQHLDQPDFAATVISSEKILESITPSEREGLVWQVYLKARENKEWIKTALKVGISRQAIAAMIVAKINSKAEEVIKFFLEKGMGEYHLLSWGLSSNDYEFETKPCHWNMFRNDMLARQFKLCAEVMPKLIFAKLDFIRSKVGKELTEEICLVAAEYFRDLDNVNFDLDRCSIKVTKKITESVKGVSVKNYQYLNGVALVMKTLNGREQEEYFCKVWPYLQDLRADLVYLKLWLPNATGNVQRVITRNLLQNGFFLGRVQFGTHLDPKKRERENYFVMSDDGKIKYLYSHRFGERRIRENKLVIVDSRSSTYLAERDGIEIRIAPLIPVDGR